MIRLNSIAKKIGAAFSTLIFLMFCVGITVWLATDMVQKEMDELQRRYVPFSREANEMERDILQSMYVLRGFILSSKSVYMEKMDELLDHGRAAAKAAEETGLFTDEIKELFRDLTAYEDLILDAREQTAQMNQAITELESASAAFTKGMKAYRRSLNTNLETMILADFNPAALTDSMNRIRAANYIYDLHHELKISLFQNRLERDSGLLKDARQRNMPLIRDILEKALAEAWLIEEKKEIKQVIQAVAQYEGAIDRLTSRLSALQEIDAKPAAIAAKAEALSAQSTGSVVDIAGKSAEHLKKSARMIYGALCLAILIGAGISLMVARFISKPILEGVRFAGEISDGDLRASISIKTNDEIGRLADALKGMRNRLRDVVRRIRQSADKVAEGATQFSASAEEMSQGANEQAANAEEISAAMEEFTANIRQNTDNAAASKQIALQVSQDASSGGAAVAETVQAMRTVAGKVSIINEIARNTDLLALNAAIEAARVGELGKGFAVVAGEVRKLAERSQTAAGEINRIVEDSLEIAEDAGIRIANILPDIQRAAELISEIADAGAEQDRGADQINKGLLEMDNVIQKNAGAAQEIAGMSRDLEHQAATLRELIAVFRIPQETGTPDAKPEDRDEPNGRSGETETNEPARRRETGKRKRDAEKWVGMEEQDRDREKRDRNNRNQKDRTIKDRNPKDRNQKNRKQNRKDAVNHRRNKAGRDQKNETGKNNETERWPATGREVFLSGDSDFDSRDDEFTRF